MMRLVFCRYWVICSFILLSTACGLTPNKPEQIPEVKIDSPHVSETPAVIETEVEQSKVVEKPVEKPIEPVVIKPIVTPPQACVAKKEKPKIRKVINSSLLIIGAVEYVTITDKDLRLKARIDTGAQTSSIGVDSVQMFERDGERWVMFTIKDRNTQKIESFKRALKRNVRIKQHEQSPDRRQVVEMTLSLGTITRKVEVTLNNRDDFKYPLLIGRNFLDAEAVVDVSRRYLMLDKEN